MQPTALTTSALHACKHRTQIAVNVAVYTLWLCTLLSAKRSARWRPRTSESPTGAPRVYDQFRACSDNCITMRMGCESEGSGDAKRAGSEQGGVVVCSSGVWGSQHHRTRGSEVRRLHQVETSEGESDVMWGERGE